MAERLNLEKLRDSTDYLRDRALAAANRHETDIELAFLLGWMSAEIVKLREIKHRAEMKERLHGR